MVNSLLLYRFVNIWADAGEQKIINDETLATLAKQLPILRRSFNCSVCGSLVQGFAKSWPGCSHFSCEECFDDPRRIQRIRTANRDGRECQHCLDSTKGVIDNELNHLVLGYGKYCYSLCYNEEFRQCLARLREDKARTLVRLLAEGARAHTATDNDNPPDEPPRPPAESTNRHGDTPPPSPASSQTKAKSPKRKGAEPSPGPASESSSVTATAVPIKKRCIPESPSSNAEVEQVEQQGNLVDAQPQPHCSSDERYSLLMMSPVRTQYFSGTGTGLGTRSGSPQNSRRFPSLQHQVANPGNSSVGVDINSPTHLSVTDADQRWALANFPRATADDARTSNSDDIPCDLSIPKRGGQSPRKTKKQNIANPTTTPYMMPGQNIQHGLSMAYQGVSQHNHPMSSNSLPNAYFSMESMRTQAAFEQSSNTVTGRNRQGVLRYPPHNRSNPTRYVRP